jgi:hypothetical protein
VSGRRGRTPGRNSRRYVAGPGAGSVEPPPMTTTEQDIQLKQIAAQLTASMLDNHNGDWNDQDAARAFQTIYQAVKNAA